ncbi:redoxin domain-containing protein, partial [Acinetobacter baumannii]|uniref:redoxin domain-containing protein n=1 Tax=Acinetobacter baumannii TaxID=470 RepID=UPI001B37D551
RQDLPTELAAYAQRHGVAFPLLKDLDNKVADALGARRTPEVFVLDRERVVRYHGRIDDQHQPGIQGNRVARHDLREALVELVAGEPISTPETPITGCLIGRVNRRAEPPRAEPVVWSKQISRIFQERCQECHRPGEIGPFPLLTYEDTQGW